MQFVIPEVRGAFEALGLVAARASNVEAVTFITPILELTGQLYDGESNGDYFTCTPRLSEADWTAHNAEFIVITTISEAEGGGSSVETIIEADVWDRFTRTSVESGGTKNAGCVGTGRLERSIAARLRARSASCGSGHGGGSSTSPC